MLNKVYCAVRSVHSISRTVLFKFDCCNVHMFSRSALIHLSSYNFVFFCILVDRQMRLLIVGIELLWSTMISIVMSTFQLTLAGTSSIVRRSGWEHTQVYNRLKHQPLRVQMSFSFRLTRLWSKSIDPSQGSHIQLLCIFRMFVYVFSKFFLFLLKHWI